MATARETLLKMLQHVADGGDVTEQELNAAIPDPMVLDPEERKGWEELSHWTDDADIRAKDERYANFKRNWIGDRIAALNP